MPITTELMTSLYKRGIREVVISEKDWRRLNAFGSHGKARVAAPRHAAVQSKSHTEASLRLDAEAVGKAPNDLLPSAAPFSSRLRRVGAVAYLREEMDRTLDHHRRSVEQVAELFAQLSQGRQVSGEAIRKLAGEALERAAEDFDLFICMGINPSDETETFAHATNVATLAIGLGIVLGQSVEALEELGMGCLLHDAGMLRIDQRIARSNEWITERDYRELAEHPLIAVDLLDKLVDRVPLAARMVVYQMHERGDGSGYPRGRTAETIHPLAKIAAVADAYVALVSKRRYRPAMLPYFAMAKMLEDVKAGLFAAPVVRALLYATSLFPTGSYVELSDGRVAKTIRANGPSFDRPIIEARDRDRLRSAAEVIDLSRDTTLHIVKPLAMLQMK